MSIPEGKKAVGSLMDKINLTLSDINWNPKNVCGNSTIEFIETKALFVYAKRKLKSISKREGYE